MKLKFVPFFGYLNQQLIQQVKFACIVFLMAIGMMFPSALDAQTYCASNANSTFATNIISDFQLNTINHTMPPTACSNYQDLTNVSTNLNQLTSYPVSISGAVGCGTPQFAAPTWSAAVFIDYNRDGDFLDPGEAVLRLGPANTTAATLTGNFTVPIGLSAGPTRMRVILRDISTPVSITPCGTYTAGETIDFTVNIQPTAAFDIGVISARAGKMYTQTPLPQATFDFEADLINGGNNVVTGATANLNIQPGTFSANAVVGTVLPAAIDNATFSTSFTAPAIGNYRAFFNATINEQDGFPNNDTFSIPLIVTDSVMSRDNNIVTGGIGGNNPIEFGQTYELNTADTLTSVTIRLQSPTVGARLRVYVRGWNNTTNLPGAKIDSSRLFEVPAAGASNYTLKIGCGQTVLPPGKYYVGVDQVDVVNASLAYSLFKNIDETYVYVDLKGGAGFLPSTSTSLNALVNDITLFIRPNFGRYSQPSIVQGGSNAEFCFGQNTVLRTNDFRSFVWNTGSIRDSLVVSTAGTYSVTATDELGCVFSQNITVTERSSIPYNENIIDASQCGGNDGSAQITATGGIPPYSYLWANGDTVNFRTNLSGGSYNLTITDGDGCEQKVVVGVGGANPIINLNATSPSCNGFSNGSVKVQVIEGGGPFTFSWSNGGTDSLLQNVGAGPYTVTVTDRGGCETTGTIILQNNPIIRVDDTNSKQPSVCGANDAEAIINVSGGVQPYSYLWENGASLPIRIGLLAGTYKVSVTDGVGCLKVHEIVINDPNAPSISTTDGNVNCGKDRNGTATVNVTGGANPVNVLWSNGQTTNTATGLTRGVYTVRATDALGCIAFGTATVSGPEPINLSLGINYGRVCEDEVFIQNLSGGEQPYTYLWDDANSSTASSLSMVCNGSYKLIVTDNLNCKDSAVVVVFNPRTSVSDLKATESITVYPNPASDKLFVEAENLKLRTLSLLSISGQKIIQIENPNSNSFGRYELGLNNLSSGFYILQLMDNQNVLHTTKISISR